VPGDLIRILYEREPVQLALLSTGYHLLVPGRATYLVVCAQGDMLGLLDGPGGLFHPRVFLHSLWIDRGLTRRGRISMQSLRIQSLRIGVVTRPQGFPPVDAAGPCLAGPAIILPPNGATPGPSGVP
jgi:hypothetical protein